MTTTPNELAKEIGISPKTLRAWLRKRWPDHEKHSRWHLSPWQCNVARNHWRTIGYRHA